MFLNAACGNQKLVFIELPFESTTLSIPSIIMITFILCALSYPRYCFSIVSSATSSQYLKYWRSFSSLSYTFCWMFNDFCINYTHLLEVGPLFYIGFRKSKESLSQIRQCIKFKLKLCDALLAHGWGFSFHLEVPLLWEGAIFYLN